MLGMQTVIDLRTKGEVDAYPGPIPYLHLEIPTRKIAQSNVDLLRDRADGERWLYENYCEMIRDAAPVFGELFSRIADDEHLPAVLHCYGGKDRTGLAIALLLSCLGVDREVVLDDYELSNCHRPLSTCQKRSTTSNR